MTETTEYEVPPEVDETLAALDVARRMAAAGVPIFIAHPADNKTGFTPPRGWESTEPDPSVVDGWEPGLALCAVMGRGLDLVDIDPRNGGSWPTGVPMPTVLGMARTPSGGMHAYVRSLGAGSRDGVLLGIDVKGGRPDGSGRGFAFIAPTVRASAVTGERETYRWAQEPALMALSEPDDGSGIELAAAVTRALSGHVRRQGGPDWWREWLRQREPQSQAAARGAIADKVAEVEEWTPGSGEGFRGVLMRAAMTLGGYVGGGWLDETEARERLESACAHVWGNPDDDDRKWVEQGLSDGQLLPFWVYSPSDLLRAGAPADRVFTEGPPCREHAPDGSSTGAWTAYHVIGDVPFDPPYATDQELGEAVLERIRSQMRFAIDAKTWLIRRRERWTEDQDGAGSAVSALAHLMPVGDPDFPKSKGDWTEAHWQAKRRARFLNSGTAGAIERKMRSVVTIPGHSGGVELSALDSDPEVLWAGGVAWDLRASADAPTRAGWLGADEPHMHAAWVAPDSSVETPRWDAFIHEVFPDPLVRAWALRVLSIGLTGYPDAALPILYGRERSGKTSVIEMLMRVLGSYGRPANVKLLSDNRDHDAIIYELKGTRLAFVDEGPRRGHDATERLKQLTGGGQLTGRPMRANPIAFHPTHTLVMTTNVEPQLTDPALRARARLIPCDAPESRVRPVRQALLDPRVLYAEAPGILAGMMRESALWLADRDSASTDIAPDLVRGMATEIAEDQDPVRQWVEDKTVPADPGTPGKRLYLAFADWHQSQALHRRASVPSMTAFGRTLTEMGYPSVKTQGCWYRPLSVLDGFVGPTVPPSPGTFMASGGFVGGGELGAGLGGAVANRQNARSGSAFVSGGGGLASYIHTPPVENNTHTENTQKTQGKENATNKTRDFGRQVAEPAAAPPLTCEKGVGDPPSASRRQVANDREPPLSPERAAVAARAHADKVTKVEARARVREEARLAAVAEAQGEVRPLPVVVDRAGHVVSVTPEQARKTVAACLRRTSGELTVDVETTGYPAGHRLHALRSVQLGDDQAAVVLRPGEDAGLIEAALSAASRLVAHSASADIVPLAMAGLVDPDSAWARMHDTVIPAKLGDPKSTGADPALKRLSEAVLGHEAVSPAADADRQAVFKAGKWLTGKQKFADQLTLPIERNGWAQIETGSEVMLRYAASDVLDTAALARRLPTIPHGVYERERLAESMTARVALRGLAIDEPRVDQLVGEHTEAKARAAKEVGHWIENPGSNQQVAAALVSMGAQLPFSAAGNPSVAEHVLTRLKRTEGESAELARRVLDYRHADTALGLFLGPYKALCTHGDGRMRPIIYTLGTDTGRMSSVRPNCQQLPRAGGMRSIMVADPGFVFISADFSGVELRGAAALSQDQAMLHMIHEEDEGRFDGFHWQVARQAFGKDATKGHRYIAKRGVFGTFYGGGAEGLAKQVGVPVEEMQLIRDSLRAIAPDYFAWADRLRYGVRAGHTQFPAYSGRVIHFPGDTPHKAPAYAIQGTCRELLVDALCRWRDTRWGECTLMPVHDELVVQVPEEDATEATTELVNCMASELFGVRIVAEPSEPSRSWQDSV